MQIKKLIITFLLVLWPCLVWGATYYVSQSGTGDGSAVGTPDSLADFEADVFGELDGDTVYILGTITDQVDIPDSGTSGNEVTIRGDYSGQECTINGADDILATGDECDEAGDWNEDEGDGIWQCAVASEPYIVVTNGSTIGTEADPPAAESNWTYDGANLEVFTATGDNNPVSYFTSIEIGQHSGIDTGNEDYIIIDGFTTKNTQKPAASFGAGIHATDTSTNITVQNCTVIRGHGYGILFEGVNTGTITGNTISGIDSQNDGNSGDGIHIRHASDNTEAESIIVSNNTISGYIDRGGIVNVGGNSITISNNDLTGVTLGANLGGHIDFEPTTPRTTNDCVVSGNSVRRIDITTDTGTIQNITVSGNTVDNTGSGAPDEVIFNVNEVTGTNYFQDNTIIDDVQTGNAYLVRLKDISDNGDNYFQRNYIRGGGSTASIQIDDDDAVNNGTWHVINNVVNSNGCDRAVWATDDGTTCVMYNNSFVEYAQQGFYLDGDQGADPTFTIKNNIFSSTTDASRNIYIEVDAEANLTFDYNLYDPDDSFSWAEVSQNWATWSAARDTNSPTPADPLFLKAGGDNARDYIITRPSLRRSVLRISGVNTDYFGWSRSYRTEPGAIAYRKAKRGGANVPTIR